MREASCAGSRALANPHPRRGEEGKGKGKKCLSVSPVSQYSVVTRAASSSDASPKTLIVVTESTVDTNCSALAGYSKSRPVVHCDGSEVAQLSDVVIQPRTFGVSKVLILGEIFHATYLVSLLARRVDSY